VKANNINMMKYSRPILATLLMSGGLLQLVAPVLAETAAGTAISNTATASYDDPGNPGTPINATSNEVKVIVAEVAGIDVSGSGITDVNGGSVVIGDVLQYNFTVTNVGNTPTTIHIPAQPTITGPGTFNTLQYKDSTGAWVDLPADGNIPGVPPGGVVEVRATVTVNNGTGSTIAVQLGNTPGDAANEPLVSDGNPNNVNTTGGAPANGQRESSATQSVNVGATVKNIALATVTETRGVTNDNNTPLTVTDDSVSYSLGLKVAATDITNSGITPTALAGSTFNGDPAVKRILVSSAIPVGTKLAEAATAPAGWRAVYTTTLTSTNANDATWSTVFDPNVAYTRVGFINENSSGVVTSPVVAAGAEVNGFAFKLKTTAAITGLPDTTVTATSASYKINSMAQLFGTTSGDTAATPVLVYDESGDQVPNNFESLTSLVSAAPNDGVAIPGFVVDTVGDNSAVGSPAGEINQYTYTYTLATDNSLLNGPIGVPEAVGPTNTNDDFTNKSTTVPAGTAPTATFDPAAAGFNNTVKNTGNAPANISLLPEVLATDTLPEGTTVTISANGQSATYKVINDVFVYDSGTGTNSGGVISATNPVKLDAVGIGATAAYQVSVDLKEDATTTPLKSFPVVINASIPATANAPAASNKTIDRVYTGFLKLTKETRILQGTGPAVQGADSTFSTTSKTPASGNIIEYRITYENISDKLGNSTGSSVMNAANLVITENGTGIDPVTGFPIVGGIDPVTNLPTVGVNTWAKDSDNNNVLDTSNVIGSAVDSNSSSIISLFYGANGATPAPQDQSGTTAATDITRYVNKVTTVVAPGGMGTFSFKRKLN
jgi:uncharacterized repeat protein (TIGR01451 family)